MPRISRESDMALLGEDMMAALLCVTFAYSGALLEPLADACAAEQRHKNA